MLNSLRNILHLKSSSGEDQSQLDTVIAELTAGIESVKIQHQKISNQETKILQKLENYELQHSAKIKDAKQALRSKNELTAESLYKESKILKGQINQYQRIVREIQETKRKLLSQESQFRLTKDELSAKKMVGEANVDATQLNAEMSEQLMFLNESGALTQFDELILDATCKSQAIEEIQGSANSFDHYLEDSDSAIDDLQHAIKEENEEKMKASLRNQQILIEKAFGKTEPSVDTTQKDKQGTLLDQLRKQDDTTIEKKDRIDFFFKATDEVLTEKPKAQDITKDKEDRVKNFFK